MESVAFVVPECWIRFLQPLLPAGRLHACPRIHPKPIPQIFCFKELKNDCRFEIPFRDTFVVYTKHQ